MVASTSLRLGLVGGAQIKSGFADIAQSGTASFTKVGDVADAQAKRWGRAYDNASRDAEAAMVRLSTARTKLDLLMPGLNPTKLDAAAGIQAGVGKAASDSATVFEAAFARMDSAAATLAAKYDPLLAAQQRYDEELGRAKDLLDAGSLSTERYEQIQRSLTATLNDQRRAADDRAAAVQRASAATLEGAAGVRSGPATNSASASASVFEDYYAQMERRANALRAAIDPAFAAQQRFDREIAEARSLISSGAISLDDYAKRHVQLQREMTLTTRGLEEQAGASGAAKAGYQQLNFQLSDIATQFSSGTPPMQIFAQQSGQLFQALGLIASGGAAAGKGVEAAADASEDSAPDIAGFGEQVTGVAEKAEGLTGKLGAVAGFMTGPWGAATLVAVSLLTPFIAKLFESNDALGDAVQKLKENAEAADVSRRAQEAFAKSSEGVAAAIRDQANAFSDADKAQRSAAERANIEAKLNLQREISIRRVTLAMIEQARAQADSTISPITGGGGAVNLAQAAAASRAIELQAQADAQKAAIATAQQNVERSRIDLATEGARRAVDPVARLNKLYDDRIAKVRLEASEAVTAGRVVGAATQRRIEAIEAERKAALKAEQDKQSASRDTARQIGRNVSLAEARAIAESIGGKVTSDRRSREEQQRLYDKYVAYKNGTGPWAALAAKPGTSNHESGQALDIAKSGGVTLAKIIAAYRRAGVTLSEALDEGSHYHIAFRKTGEAAREAAEDRKDAAKVARDAAAAERDLTSDLREVVQAYDPARAAAEDYAATLAKIDALVRGGKLTLGQASDYRAAAARTEQKRIADEQYEAFKRLFGTDDPLADVLGNASRWTGDRANEAAEQDAAKLKIVTAALDELRGYGAEFVDTVLDPDTWSSWGNAGRTILGGLKAEFVKLALLNPLKNLINGDKALPTLSSAIANIGKLFNGTTTPPLKANATGTEWWSGGMSLVGENGPEIVSMPRGSRVTPAADTRRMLAGNDNRRGETHVHVYAEGAVLTDTVRGWVAEGVEIASMRGAAGGSAMSMAEGRASAARGLGRRWSR